MQRIGNTYQDDSVNLAVSGKAKASTDATSKIDFSALLNSAGQSSSSLNSSSLSQIHQQASEFAAKLNENRFAAKKNDTQVTSKEDKSYKTSKDETVDDEDETKEKRSDSYQIYTSEDEFAFANQDIVAELMQQSAPVDINKSFANASLNQIDTAKDPEANNFQTSLKELSLIAQDNDIDLSSLDSESLKSLVDEYDALKNQSSDMKSLESSITKFVKNSLDFAKSQSTGTQTQSGVLQQEVNSMLKDLNASNVKVSQNTQNTADAKVDFGAKDFDVIEQSIKASNLLDDELSDIDEQSKITELMDSKSEANKDTLARSLELLKKTSSGVSQSETFAKNNRVDIGMSAQVKDGEKSSRNLGPETLEEAISTIKNSSATSQSLGAELKQNLSQDNQSSNQQFNQNLFSASSALQNSKTATGAATTSRLDLLQMSQNLKDNAQAITEKVMQMASKNLKTVDMDLNPEGLGKMKISIDATSADEIAKITISASSSSTRALVENGLDALKQTLREVHITADAEVGDYHADDSSSNDQNSGFAQQHGQNNSHDNQSGERQNQHENQVGTIFASSQKDGNVSENDTVNIDENINNSQNSNTVSYFA